MSQVAAFTGSVCPLLDELAGKGLVGKRADGKYELTEKASKLWTFRLEDPSDAFTA